MSLLSCYWNSFLVGFQLSWKWNVICRVGGEHDVARKLENCSPRAMLIRRSTKKNFKSNNLYS